MLPTSQVFMLPLLPLCFVWEETHSFLLETGEGGVEMILGAASYGIP